MDAAPPQSKYASLTPARPAGVPGRLLAAMDRGLNFMCWTTEAEMETGLAAREVLGRSLYEVFPEARGSPAEAQYFQVFATGRPVTIVTELDDTRREITACLCNDVLCLLLWPLSDGAADAPKLRLKTFEPRRSQRQRTPPGGLPRAGASQPSSEVPLRSQLVDGPGGALPRREPRCQTVPSPSGAAREFVRENKHS